MADAIKSAPGKLTASVASHLTPTAGHSFIVNRVVVHNIDTVPRTVTVGVLWTAQHWRLYKFTLEADGTEGDTFEIDGPLNLEDENISLQMGADAADVVQYLISYWDAEVA